MAPLSARNGEVKRLRRLLRDPGERAMSGCCALDNPRAILGALERGAGIESVYVDLAASDDARRTAERARAAGIRVESLEHGVATRVADVRASAGLLAIVRCDRSDQQVCDEGDFWLVVAQVSDPGNLGTLIRSAEAAGASGIIVGTGSVDVYNPKVVRASAGAVFGIPIVEGTIVELLRRLGERGLVRLGAVAHHGSPIDTAPLAEPVAIVLGHETRGLGELTLDGFVEIPMAKPAESLNLAMAGSILLFETARRRRSVESS